MTEIVASHEYLIEQDSETNDWRKDEGTVVYKCGTCQSELSIADIQEILKQVDEL